MNIRTILCILSMYACMLYPQFDKNQQHHSINPQGQPTMISITLNTANQAQVNQQSNFKQEANNISTQNTDVTTKYTRHDTEPNFKQNLYDMYEEQRKKAQETSTDIIAWIQDNRLATVGLGVLISYSYIMYKIHRTNLIFSDVNSWSNWHSGRSLDDLFAMSHHKLESDLLFEIQTRYVHPGNPTDFIYSIVQSSVSLNSEIDTLQEQISRYKWLATFQCMPLFFINTKELEALQEKHRKLSFMKHIFASWCANYKINKNN